MKKYTLIAIAIFTMGISKQSMGMETIGSFFSASEPLEGTFSTAKVVDQDKLGQKLGLSLYSRVSNFVRPVPYQNAFPIFVEQDALMFLKGIYSNLSLGLKELEEAWDKNPSLLESCKKAEMDGCSALGVATMMQGASFEQKQTFIKKLLNLGFEPTENDRELSNLECFSRTLKELKKLGVVDAASVFSSVDPESLISYESK